MDHDDDPYDDDAHFSSSFSVKNIVNKIIPLYIIVFHSIVLSNNQCRKISSCICAGKKMQEVFGEWFALN